jgi:hypothetical protein
MGLMPEAPSPGFSMSPTASATPATTTEMSIQTGYAKPVETGMAPNPSVAPVPMTSLMSLSDRPSDGGPPQGSMDAKFWESMPTLQVPGHLANPQAGGWELDPGEGWE